MTNRIKSGKTRLNFVPFFAIDYLCPRTWNALKPMLPADYFGVMMFVAPALCSLVCSLILALPWRSPGRSSGRSSGPGTMPETGRRRRALVAITFMIISALWIALLAIPGRGSFWILLASVLVPLCQVWFSSRIVRSPESPADSATPVLSGLSRELIENHFITVRPWLSPDFGLSDLAASLGSNRSAVSSLINRTFGMNFKSYVNSWRLAEYERLESLPSSIFRPLSRLVLEAGFSDVRHYRRALAARETARQTTRETAIKC